MDKILVALQGLPIPTILVVSGLILMFLAFVGEVAGKVKIAPERQKWAAIVGIILFILGIVLYIAPILPKGDAKSGEAEAGDPAEFLAAAQGWDLVYQEPWMNNNAGWWVGTLDDEFARATWTVNDGVYRWKMRILQPERFHYYIPSLESVADFYFSVRVRMAGQPDYDGMYGLALRRVGNSFYAFRIDQERYWQFWFYNGEAWTMLVDQADTTAVLPGRSNQLAVIAEGYTFNFFINGQHVGSYEDTLAVGAKVGQQGFLAGLHDTGDSATFEFDDLELRKKPQEGQD